jgi:bifunctional enzyme CysN/CysC
MWMADEELLPGRPYWLKLGTQTVTAQIPPRPKYKINVNTMEHLAAKTLGAQRIGVANLSTDKPLRFEPYAKSRDMGGFILIDKLTNATVGAGMIISRCAARANVHWQALDVDRDAHAAQESEAAVLWFTGLPGSGKSTIANLVRRKLHALGKHTFLLDGDNVRHGLNKRSRLHRCRPRREHPPHRRSGASDDDAGLIVLTAFISPFRAERRMVRGMSPPGEFIEIYVETPLEVAEQRDVKGLYKKARAGELKNFTGIDSPYEPPENPEIRVNTVERPSRDSVRVSPVIACLETVYATEWGRGTCAESEPLLMILPPRGACIAIRRKASRAHRNAPVTLT